MRAEVRLLGPVEVVGTMGVVWGGTRRRSVLALLALCPGRVVSCAALIDALWGDDLPATALKTVQAHVAQVRRAMADAGLPGVVVTRGPGYLLDVERTALDTDRFARHTRAGRHALEGGAAEAAIGHFRAGLALWRGDPLADCPVTGWASAEVTHLREARALAEEHLATALCRAGRHAQAVGELERLVVRHPFRERLWELLMVAQYRSDRPADALRTYRRVRAMLVDEFGLEPGAALRRVHAAVLSGNLEPVT